MFNELADRLARQLASAFGYPLAEAEQHIVEFYRRYEEWTPVQAQNLKEKGINPEWAWTAKDYFWHEDSALVLELGYELAGGKPHSLAFSDWRKGCWDALRNGQRVPLPDFPTDSID